MIGIADAFSPSYARARIRFLEAAAAAGAAIESHDHPLPGRDGERLALDSALDGAADAERLLVVSSGCHGVEGHCGSGVQVFALHDDEWREKARAARVAVLYLHALNPWGFSFGRRVTEHNVDLNRNFLDFSRPDALPPNAQYRALHALLLPGHWPPDAANQAALAGHLATHGAATLQAAVARGQYEFPDGLFFGGSAPSWSRLTLCALLRRHAQQALRVGWIDVHSGLGPESVGERIFAGDDDDAAALARARRWWGDAAAVTSTHDGSAVSATVTGTLGAGVRAEFPQAEYTAIALEFGTAALPQVLHAMRAEQWLQSHPDAPAPLAASIRRAMRDAFYVDRDDWKGQVISQARQALFQAVDGLAR